MKTCFHSHFYANFHEFLRGAINAANILQLYTASFLYLTHLEWWSSYFPNFDGPNVFPPKIQRAPGPDFRNVGKSLLTKSTGQQLKSSLHRNSVIY